MAEDNEISVRITAAADSVEAGMQAASQAIHNASSTINTSFAQLSATIQQFNGNLNAAATALNQQASAQRTTASATQQTAAATQQAAAATATLTTATTAGTAAATQAAAAQTQAAGAINQVGAAANTAGTHIGVGATAMREFIVVGHELLVGNFSRIPGSLLVLSERLNGLGAVVNVITGAWGPFIIGAAAAAAGLGYIAYQAYETNKAIKELTGGLQFSGGSESTEEVTRAYQKLQEAFHLSSTEAREVAATMSHLTGVARDYWEALGEVASAQARVEHTEIKKSLEEVFRAAEHGAKGLLEYADKHRLVDGAQKTTFENMIKGGREVQAFQEVLNQVITAVDQHGGALERDKAQMDNWIDSARNMIMAGGEAAGAMLNTLPSPPAGAPSITGASPQELNALALIRQHENAGGDPGLWNKSGSDASGLYQIRTPTWARWAQGAGVGGQYPNAATAPSNIQDQVALYGYRKEGFTPWQASAPPGGYQAALASGGQSEAVRQQIENAAKLNKTDQERQQTQARIQTTSEAIGRLIAESEAAGNDEVKQKSISAQLDTQRKAQNEAILELAKLHSLAEQDAHKATIAQLEAQKTLAHTAQEKLQLEKQIQAENVRFAGSTPASSAEAARANATAQKAADDEALRSKLITTEKAAAADRHNDELALQSKREELAAIGAAHSTASIDYQQKELEIVNFQSQMRDKAYRVFAEGERLKIQELKGSISEQQAEYSRWLSQITTVYKQDQAEYEKVQREKVKAAQTGAAQAFSEQMRLVGDLGRVYHLEDQAFSRAMKQMVDERKITVQQMDGFIEQEVAKNIDAQVKILESIKNTGNLTAAEQRQVSVKIIELEEEKATKIAALNERIAAANKAALDKQTAEYKQFASSVGSDFQNFLEAGILRTETRAKALTNLLDSVAKAGIKLAGNLLSQGAAKLGANALNITLEPGAGLSQLFQQGIGKLFGMGSDVAGKSVETTALLAAQEAQTDKLIIANTANTTLITSAIAAAALQQSIAAQIPKPLGFLGGGIVPSAQGGMLTGTGTLALLHQKEMVLPERISTRLQAAINSGNFSGGINSATNTANLTYAPVFQGGSPFMTRSALEATLRSHGDTLVGYAQNLIRNGWRP